MNTRYWLVLIFLGAFGLRLGATIKFEGLREGPRRSGFSDGVDFSIIATNLVVYGDYAYTPGQTTAFRAPGFSFLLAGIYRVAGINNFIAIRLAQCLIGAALVLVVYGLGKHLGGETVGFVAAGLTAVYPNIFYYTIHFSSEPLYTLLLAGATLAFAMASGRERQRVDSPATNTAPQTPLAGARGYIWFMWAGILLGFAALTRPMAFYFLPLFALAGWWRNRRQWTGIMLFVIATFLAILPWALRNYRAFDRWCLFTTNGGSTFWGANNEIVLNDPAHRGQWISTNELGEKKAAVKNLPNEVDRDRLEMENGKQFLRDNAPVIPRLAWYKFREFWTPFCKTPNQKFNLIILVSYAPLLPFMLIGLWRLRTKTDWGVLLAPVVGTVFGALVFYGSARFRSTIDPFLLIGAAVSLTHLMGIFSRAVLQKHRNP
ncbi:MAG: glycosyltransferase family 39 protein [Verrucomicrobiota bacterium]